MQTLFTTEETVSLLTRLKSRFSANSSFIEEGESADITLFNPDVEWVFETKDILSTSKNAALLGKKLKGKPYGIYANGILKIA